MIPQSDYGEHLAKRARTLSEGSSARVRSFESSKKTSKLPTPDHFINQFINENYFFNRHTQCYKSKDKQIDFQSIELAINANCGMCTINTLAERLFFGDGGLPANPRIGYDIIRHGIRLGFKPAGIILDQQREKGFGISRLPVVNITKFQKDHRPIPVYECTVPSADRRKRRVANAIANIIAIDTSMRHLVIKKINLGRTGMGQIGQALGLNTTLTKLSFNRCKWKVDNHSTMPSIAEYLDRNRRRRAITGTSLDSTTP